MSAPENRKYTKSHEWVQVDGDVVTVGMTDYAQQELGDITYLELAGTRGCVSAGEPFGVVESVKAASDSTRRSMARSLSGTTPRSTRQMSSISHPMRMPG